MTALQTPALLLDRDLSMTVGIRELGEPQPDEALIRIRWSGLCGSDLHVMRTGDWVSDWPATLGHEIYGTVEEVQAGGAFSPGDAVVADSRIPCGHCPFCLAGDSDRCIDVRFVGEARPGGFAEHCVLPTSLLHRVPPELQSPAAALSEPLAVVLHGLSLLRAEPRNVAILGHGPIGALNHAELRRRFPDADITVAEPAPLRAQLARALGAQTRRQAKELTPTAYDTVIDAAGYATSLSDALAAAAPRGQVLVLALSFKPTTLVPAALVERSITVIGANAFVDELPRAIEVLASERWRYEPIITDAVSLAELPDTARRQLEQPDAVKVLVCP
jgi:2-desacetyl-2-hydroxyethyl bacteriochlorophyllide A dehydrogenase